MRAEALRNYLERLGELVSNDKLRTLKDPYDDKRILARVQTKTVLRGLSPTRKRDVLLFLREMRLINREDVKLNGTTVHQRIVGLSGADLSNADLRNMRFISTSREEPVSLEGAILEGADLTYADLERADLSDAVLRGASLKGANLRGTSLREADLNGADLSDADLRSANLQGVQGVTRERLEGACKSLAGATMPDGSQHD